MKSFSQKFYTFSYGFIRVLSLGFAGILLLGGFLGTCYALDMTTQEALSKWDNPFISLAGLAAFLIFIILLKRWVCRDSARRLPLLLLLALAWCTLLGVILILFGKTVPAADALSVYTIAESLAGGDTSVIHPTDSYLSYYPQQVGLTAFFELLIRIWNLLPTGLPAYHMIKCVYVLLAWVIILFQYQTVRLLWKDDQAGCIYLILMGANLPFFMYTSFVYGEIPSFAAISIGLYCLFKLFILLSDKTCKAGQAWFFFAASLLMLTLSVFLRKNSLIVIIAAVLVILFQWVKTKRFPLLWLALLCGICSITVLPLTQKYYEHRAGSALNSGVPAMSYFAMGMQEASRGNGWYNGFNFYTYQDTGMDTAETVAVSKAAIAKRLAYFREHPGYAVNFYLHKYLTQWADGTYACRQATLATFGGRRSFFDSLYAGEGSIYFIAYCNHYQNVIYLGVFLFCLGNLLPCRHRFSAPSGISENAAPAATDSLRGLPPYLGLISAFGGFLFHMAWEANSRYIFVYGLLLLPYAARGLALGDAYLSQIFHSRAARH